MICHGRDWFLIGKEIYLIKLLNFLHLSHLNFIYICIWVSYNFTINLMRLSNVHLENNTYPNMHNKSSIAFGRPFEEH